MMRSLYTAASGMRAQQTNLDVISNNLANVNSTGYKTSTAEFKSLLYQTLQTRSTSANGDYKPIGAQVGTGTRNASITTRFTQGAMLETANDFGFGIEGDGFSLCRQRMVIHITLVTEISRWQYLLMDLCFAHRKDTRCLIRTECR